MAVSCHHYIQILITVIVQEAVTSWCIVTGKENTLEMLMVILWQCGAVAKCLTSIAAVNVEVCIKYKHSQ